MASHAARAPIAGDSPRPTAGAGARVTLLARDWHEFDRPEAIAQWDSLTQWASEPNPFYESWYLLASLRSLDARHRVKLLCLEVDGQLAGLMPLASSASYYGYPFPHARNWVHSNCFFGAPLVAKGCEGAFWRALFDWCDGSGLGLFLHLDQMPMEGTLFDALKATCAAQGRTARLVGSEIRAMLASDLSPQEYFEAALKGKRRSELNRKRRRLSEQGELVLARDEGADDLVEWCDSFLSVESAGWKGAAGSALACDPAKERLFREALQGAAERGRLERLALYLDGRPVAMMTTFLTPPGAFGFKTAYDDEFSRFSPGVIVQQENLALLDRVEIEWCDSCSAEDHPMIDHFWRERRKIGRISIGLGGVLRRSAFAVISALEKGEAL